MKQLNEMVKVNKCYMLNEVAYTQFSEKIEEKCFIHVLEANQDNVCYEYVYSYNPNRNHPICFGKHTSSRWWVEEHLVKPIKKKDFDEMFKAVGMLEAQMNDVKLLFAMNTK